MSLADNIEFLRNLPKLPGIGGLEGLTRGWPVGSSPLAEVSNFGSNPGDLRMFSFVPGTAVSKSALVVVLHGCTQTAAGYDIGTGWSALAERYGFALLMPEQKSANNGNTCFNWFNSEDTRRDGGEALSIRQMIARMAQDHAIDPKRVFVNGLSAGGAMTSVMLGTYPEVFAAGAIIAGLPYGVADSLQEALGAMYRAPSHQAQVLGDFVRNASSHQGPWPKISVWHGSADRTVSPANANEIVKQWLDVHGLQPAPMSEGPIDGYSRKVWWNANGETVVESFTIEHMAHGTPLGIGADEQRYGVEGPFLIEAGISSSWHIAEFFGLTKAQPKSMKVADVVAKADITTVDSKPKVIEGEVVERTHIATGSAALKPRAADDRRASPRQPAGRRALDIQAAITRALTAAGLMK